MSYFHNFISESDVDNASKLLKLSEVKAGLRCFSSNNKSNIFLSHKHNEVKLVRNISLILESLDSKVYVDWKDRSLPTQTTDETAKILKEKIKSLDKFIFLASNSAINSKWCNWEIGFADANKYEVDKIVIFPVKNKDNWNGSEYLSLYPHIEFQTSSSYECFGNPRFGTYWVKYPNGNKISLKEWLGK